MRRDSLHDDVDLGGVSVLVVDDYEPLRVGVVAMLESRGAAVTAVGSADEALEALQRERPDVLVSDLAMPGKSGYWLIDQVRGLPLERGGGRRRPPRSLDSPVPSTGPASCMPGSNTTSRSLLRWRNWPGSSRFSR